MSSWANFTLSIAAMLPVTPRTIVLPWSLRLFTPRRRSAGCIPLTIAIRDIYLWPRFEGMRFSRRRASFNPRRPLAPAASMDYQTTLEHLYRLERFGIKLGLDNIRQLLSLLGDPQRGLKVLHVTGTNGKGSVCAY